MYEIDDEIRTFNALKRDFNAAKHATWLNLAQEDYYDYCSEQLLDHIVRKFGFDDYGQFILCDLMQKSIVPDWQYGIDELTYLCSPISEKLQSIDMGNAHDTFIECVRIRKEMINNEKVENFDDYDKHMAISK